MGTLGGSRDRNIHNVYYVEASIDCVYLQKLDLNLYEFEGIMYCMNVQGLKLTLIIAGTHGEVVKVEYYNCRNLAICHQFANQYKT